MRRVLICAVIAVALLCAGGAVSSTSVDVRPNSRVAAMFVGDTDRHSCTAEIIHSPGGNLLLTAAHCVSGAPATFGVEPGYDAGHAPYGRWTVDAVYLAPAWISRQDDDHDFAVLRVAPRGRSTRSLESRVGRGYTIAPFRTGASVRVIGYGAGIGDSPVGCRGVTRIARGAPTISCRGLVDGTSGSPWLVGRTVIGIVGGLRQGGCVSFVSHSPVLSDGLDDLIARADRGDPGDTPPTAIPDDC